MPYIIQQPQRTDHTPYVVFKDLFTKEECEQIINFHKVLEKKPAFIGGTESLDPEKRRSELYWIEWHAGVTDLFQKIANNVFQANQKWWGFHLSGLNESLQLTHYKSEDAGYYDWHEDWNEGPGFSHRKLSGTIQLNDGFEGGGFEFSGIGTPTEMSLGTMILFPSFKPHRVNPVTKGDRWSLVFWVSGPPFV